MQRPMHRISEGLQMGNSSSSTPSRSEANSKDAAGGALPSVMLYTLLT
jgi:hypothetical protein